MATRNIDSKLQLPDFIRSVTVIADGFEPAAVLQIDLEKGIVTRTATGETPSFATDRPGFNRRPQVEMVPSEHTDNEYTVVKTDPADPRTWMCSCPDFINRRMYPNETCKHVGYALDGFYHRVDLD